MHRNTYNWRKMEIISSDDSTERKQMRKLPSKPRMKSTRSETRTPSLHTPSDGDPIQNRMDRLLGMTRTLWEKRREFNDEMTVSSERREQLKKDISYLQERKVKCQSIIRENDAKRWRALQKFCTDNQLCVIRKREKQALNAELRKAKQTYSTLSMQAADLRKYETYMLNVIASLPKDYIKLADDVIAGLMMRYNTLYETNTSLRKEMEAKSEEVRIAQSELKQLAEAHSILLFGKNSELSELYTHREKMNDLYQGAQQSLIHSHDELAHQLSYFKTVLRSINNLTGKLVRAYEPGISGQQLLTKIQNMPILSRCRLIGDRTLAIRSIISQLASDTGTLPISTCCRPELDTAQGGGGTAASASEFNLLTKLTSAQSDANI